MMGVKYIQNRFYQEKNDLIKNSVLTYDSQKNDTDNISPEELSLTRKNVEEILGSLLFECGLREEDQKYLSIDKEFYDEYGILDQNRLDFFQREIIKNYALQDIKWTFAGTTSLLSPITNKNLIEKKLISKIYYRLR